MKTKKQHLLFFLAATSMLAACSSMDESADQPANKQQTEQQAITFGAYVNRGTTRSGKAGVLSTESLQSGTHVSDGFGVFAYYTDNAPYSTTALPNFMYNQQVTYVAGPPARWTYSPVKYWPNETSSGAQGTGIDRLTFFAYAPYVAVSDPYFGLTSEPSSGITALTRANENGFPYVRYHIDTDPSKCVDLCYATKVENMTKPTTDTPVTFNFKHALAALNVQIDADVDNTDHTHPNEVDPNTRIYVRSVSFTGFAAKGQLNLYTGGWSNFECDCDVTSAPVTIYDGRWDGYEGLSESSNETPAGLNPAIVQSGEYDTSPSFASTTIGVTKTSVNLFKSDTSGAPIYVIPTTVPVHVNIVYDVETYDPKLVSQYLSDGKTHGSTIENNITATTTIKMEAGKKYTLNLHLGMNSVKIDASVEAWPVDAAASADIDVPK